MIKFAERISEASMGGGHNIFFRVLRSSFRVRRSSVGRSVAQKGAAYVDTYIYLFIPKIHIEYLSKTQDDRTTYSQL